MWGRLLCQSRILEVRGPRVWGEGECADARREGGGQTNLGRDWGSGKGPQVGPPETELEAVGEGQGRPLQLEAPSPRGSRIAAARTPRIPLEEEEGAGEGPAEPRGGGGG